MATDYEHMLIKFLSKKADSEPEMTVREDPPGIPDPVTKAVYFSDVAQDSNRDGKEGLPNRVLAQKAKSDVAERALVGAVLNTRDFETSSVQLKPVEKVSFQRSRSLAEEVLRKCGRI